MSTLSLRSDDRMPGRSVLILADPASVTGGSSRARVLARRRLALKGLIASLVLTGLLALFDETIGMSLFVMSVGATAGYIGVLRSQALRAREARRKTRRLVPRTMDMVGPRTMDMVGPRTRPRTAGGRRPRTYAPVVRPQHLRRTGT